MDYVIIAILGFVGGGICVLVALDQKRRKLEEQNRQQQLQEQQLRDTAAAQDATQRALDSHVATFRSAEADFNARHIAYKELQDENAILKRDLFNIHFSMQRLAADGDLQRQSQESLGRKIAELGGRYLKENVKWIGSSLTPNNFSSCKQRLIDVIQRCRGINFDIPASEEAALLTNLKEDYALVVRAAFEREEQARIKAQIREEQAREREIDRELKQLEREREAIKAALARAIAEAKGQHNAEIERLEARLAEAEARSQRAISQAQLTKSGNVYVISNIGSFGEGVFKVGMTRRLEPMDRVRELGDASVPFPFDVHMMISSDNAPTLENALHRALHKLRLNKTNPRKEFFRVDIGTIQKLVQQHCGDVSYVADAEALQYRQSLAMPDDDAEFIEGVFDDLEEEGSVVADDM